MKSDEWIKAFVLVWVMVIAGVLGQQLAVRPPHATMTWMMAGIGFAALSIWDLRYWPAIFVGSMFFGLCFAPLPPGGAILLATGTTMQAVTSAYLLNRIDPKKSHLHDVGILTRLTLICVPVGGLFSASFGVLTAIGFRGLEIDQVMAHWGVRWLADTLGVLILAPPIICVGRSQTKLWSTAFIATMFPVILLLAITYTLYSLSLTQDRAHWEQVFELRTQRLRTILEQRVSQEQSVLASLQYLYAASNVVEADEFHAFNKKHLLNFPEVIALEWVPIVGSHERTRFEATHKKIIDPSFEIKERGTDNQLVKANSRSRYAPVTFVESLTDLVAPLGFDLYSTPSRAEALEKALIQNQHIATAPISLVQSPEQKKGGFLRVAPIFSKGQSIDSVADRRSAIKGYVVAVFDIGILVSRAWEPWLGNDVAATIWSQNDGLLIHSNGQPSEKIGNYSRQTVIDVAGQPWRMEFKATEHFGGHQMGWNLEGTLLAPLFFAAFLSLLLVARWGQARQIQKFNARLAQDKIDLKLFLDQVLGSINEGVVLVDDKAVVSSINLSAQRMFSVTAEEVQGHPVDKLLPTYTQIQAQTVGELSIGQGTICEWGASSLKVSDKAMTLLILRDVTERKRTHEQLKEYNEELEKSNNELEEFAYIASHDLKEPLRGISNYSHFLLEDLEGIIDDDSTQKLHTLIKLTKRLEQLIDSLLHYSRVSRVQVKYHQVPLRGIIDGAIEPLIISIEEKNATVIIRDPLPEVVCDQVYMKEVFSNLVSNSLKYSDKPHACIEIGQADLNDVELPPEVQECPHLGKSQLFYVRDDGIGIAEKHLDKVFKLFKRLHGREKYGGGHGAGLTIVKRIIERHNGFIWAESTLGEGTCIYFTMAAMESPTE